jgi:arylsulfatase A-like enzyme
VIIFFIDQQRRDTLDLHSNPLDLTPNLDRATQAGPTEKIASRQVARTPS